MDIVKEIWSRSQHDMISSESLLCWLNKWSQAFSLFRSSKNINSLPSSDQRAIALLQLHSLYMHSDLKASHDAKETQMPMTWDSHTPEFAEMVSLAEVAMPPQAVAGNEEQPLFHINLGLVPVLYSITTRCRDPIIRRRALHLMQVRSMQEGVWSSTLTSKVAQRVIELEEEGAVSSFPGGHILTSCRITNVNVEFSQDQRSATILFGSAHGNKQEIITW
jgi:hypothetical protein